MGKRTSAIADAEHPRYHRYAAYLVLSERVRGRLGLPEWQRLSGWPTRTDQRRETAARRERRNSNRHSVTYVDRR